MSIYSLTLRSLLNRKTTALLTIFSIAVSVMLLLGVDNIRREAKAGFANTISGADLIVGARSGSVQLLLYSVFRIGNATNNISWRSYQDVAGMKRVKWTIPLSLGDSHRGYRVLGTNTDYFEHFRYGSKRSLVFSEGDRFDDVYDAVLGAEVAEKLGYKLGQSIVISHGAGEVSFANHDDKPFKVVGILKKTGTPVDRTVHVSLEGIEAIHLGWDSGAPSGSISAEQARHADLQPKLITAFLVGLDSKIATFTLQRAINDYRGEPLLAILPGVALQELWSMMGVAEVALLAVSAFVVATGLIGMLTVIWSGLNERRREMAILRSVGAKPRHIFVLLMIEAGLMAVCGVLVGVGMLFLTLFAAQPALENYFGLFIGVDPLTVDNLAVLGGIILAGVLIGAAPAYRAYRYSLADGMTIRT
ncbi:ABC-type antimicrobial peptide transport system, permease component [Hahella chejuensis KCTC 2396]|uniref:ABC-type antimicrobial peptide transport system, permease component n=1 Tax=Hahella chejuensis (strain KCTC 2396) TaxID=349521 RepID=Q2SP65_HAHCH|nr:FtsX-like permease family protein [Hahella chejuensis]ABC27559.1 ABC-type antimicrobial peptide transport system, permease component [Hahella chejuensis KCTC 2396]